MIMHDRKSFVTNLEVSDQCIDYKPLVKCYFVASVLMLLALPSVVLNLQTSVGARVYSFSYLITMVISSYLTYRNARLVCDFDVLRSKRLRALHNVYLGFFILGTGIVQQITGNVYMVVLWPLILELTYIYAREHVIGSRQLSKVALARFCYSSLFYANYIYGAAHEINAM